MSSVEPALPGCTVTRLLVSDWTWRLFDEDLGGREIDFPVLGWRRIWLEEPNPGLTLEVREWSFGFHHPEAAPLPAPVWWRTTSHDQADQR